MDYANFTQEEMLALTQFIIDISEEFDADYANWLIAQTLEVIADDNLHNLN